MNEPTVSVVVPVRNEADNVAPLIAEITAALDGRYAHEIIYVNDGSTDDTGARLKTLMKELINLRQLRHARSCGQSAAVRSGVRAARGAYVVTLDGDGQNNPSFLPKMVEMLDRRRASRPCRGTARRPQGYVLQAHAIADRQQGAQLCAARFNARHRMRPEGLPARCVSGIAVLRRPASLPAGACSVAKVMRSAMSMSSTVRVMQACRTMECGIACGSGSWT